MKNLVRLIVKHYFILLFVLLEGIGMVLVFQFNPFHKSFVVNVSRYVNGAIGSKFEGIRDYIFLKEENQYLNAENVRLREQMDELTRTIYLTLPDSISSDTLAVDSVPNFKFIPTEVVSNSINKQYNYITINKGSNHLVGPDMAVIASQGIVGMVINSSGNFSTVQPIINRNAKTAVMIRGEDSFGILEWDGKDPGKCQLKEIPIHVEVQKGDTIQTSGFSTIFQKGLLVGTIEEVKQTEGNFYDIQVRLFVNFRTLNHAMVVINPMQAEQKEIKGEQGI